MECAVIAMSSCSIGGFEMSKGRRRVSSSVCVGMHGGGGGSIGIGDHHSVLGVKKNASKGEVKIAYRKLARLYHPDVCKDGEGEQRFKLINRAYESIIKDYKCFQTEVGYVNDIEDLFQTGNTEAIPDFLFNGEWFEWLNMNDSNMHHHHHDPTTLMFGQSYEELGTEWLNF